MPQALYAASLSIVSETEKALADICGEIQHQLNGAAPDLLVVFASHHHRDHFLKIPEALRSKLSPTVLLGCGAEFVAGGDQEIEDEPALSVWAAVHPGARLETFQLTFQRTPDGLVCEGFPEWEATDSHDISAVLMLGEPQTTSVEFVVNQLAELIPGKPLVGGMASGGRGRSGNVLFLGSEVIQQGAVCVAFHGGPPIKTVVSQGCRPIGKTFVVTRSERNVIFELGGETALQRIGEIWPTLSVEDQLLIKQGLHVGVAMNEYQETFRPGDFLIANVMGADQESGAIALGNFVRTGQTVQFHVRDAQTADEEMRHLLERETAETGPIGGALLFSCNGRGTRLFPQPHHDVSVIREYCGEIPLAGFFAQGELGPVAGKNYIHGYTASVVLFGQ